MLLYFSLATLVVAAVMLAFVLSGVETRDYGATRRMTELLSRIVGGAAIVGFLWSKTFGGRKGAGLVCFSFTAATGLLYIAVNIYVPQVRRRSDATLFKNVSATVDAMQAQLWNDAASTPLVAKTGDVENDRIVTALNFFVSDVSAANARLAERINSLQMRMIDAEVCAQKDSLAGEAAKRSEAIRHYDAARLWARGTRARVKAQIAAMRSPLEKREQITRGMESALNEFSVQSEELFTLRAKFEQSEINYLEFLLAHRDGYTVAKGILEWENADVLAKSKALSDARLSAGEELGAYTDKLLKAGTAANSRLMKR